MTRKATIYKYFKCTTVNGIEYWDSLEDYTHKRALGLAKKYGLRLLENWEMDKLWLESEAFRNSFEAKWYWCATVDPTFQKYAWLFGVGHGTVPNPRHNIYGMRCIKLDNHPAWLTLTLLP